MQEKEFEAHWDTLSIFGRVWLIHGMGTHQARPGQGPSPLALARVQDAAQVVVPNRTRRTRTLNGDGGVVQTVRNIQEQVAGNEWHFRADQNPRFIMELNSRHNVAYVRNNIPRPRLFASGQVYESHMLDTLVAQMFHSDATVSILEHAIGYWDGNGRYCDKRETDPENPGKMRDMESCHIEQWRIPVRFHHEAYLEFFMWALQQQVMPIALFRVNSQHKGQEHENVLPFVYTCPRKNDAIYPLDRVFVMTRWDKTEWGMDA